MTAVQHQLADEVAVPRHRCRARAYCGPAHGQSWELDARRPPPRVVKLTVDDQAISVYRLVCRPRSSRPTRDQSGYYLYVPMQYNLTLVRDPQR